MQPLEDNVPAYRTIRVAVPEDPAAAQAEEEAQQARERFPDLMGLEPVFGVAQEREAGGWSLHGYFSNIYPQQARDSLGSHLRLLAQQAEQDGDEAAHAQLQHAADRLDRERVDEMTVCGIRYRVVRAEQIIRSGPEGPEPPRNSDPDPAEPGEAHHVPDPTKGFVIDPVLPTSPAQALLKTDLLRLTHLTGATPHAQRDAATARHHHPGAALLPTTYCLAEEENGRWRPRTRHATTPQDARDTLAYSLRVLDPVMKNLDETERAAYREAADRLDEQRPSHFHFTGRHLRIVRVERFIRIGPDGPEGPRPSDPDPDPPILVQDQQLREAGELPPDDDENAEPDLPPDITARHKELFRLSIQEKERQEKLTQTRQQRQN
ncbi:DUF5954 family protein [Streptomyces sp. NRRL S-1868]|uniref:DUF5954 family protein n=1 Tax=Streptomyces sp. NRRL S-1868 TaxID=1463892 RepID=UPI0004C653A0|nr:DUF5954 family protein [Streptomyces sp. NRRL S-1868]